MDIISTNDFLPDDADAEVIEEKIIAEDIAPIIKLDYKLKTTEERRDLVERLIAQTPQEHLTNRYLEILGDYIMGGITKEEKKEKLYLTDNRRLTIDRRETSFEGLAEKFENGEDGIYALMTNDKNILFQPKNIITEQDIEEVPGLKDLRAAIDQIEAAAKVATGRPKYLLKKQLIEMRKDQYVLKNAHRNPMAIAPTPQGANKIDLTERRYVDENGEPQSTGIISFFNPRHIFELMCHYNALKLETKGHYWDDFFYLIDDFENLMHRALDDYPAYFDLARMKMNGASNIEIQQMLLKKYNIHHSIQYISTLWCNKIPKMIAEKEQNDYLLWHYRYEGQGNWKKCSCCKELKLASSRFFSKNKTSKDGFYSICKQCRNKKNNGQKINKSSS